MTVELQLWLVCNSLEHGPWEAYVPWARHKKKQSCILWSTNFHYLVQNSLQLSPILSHASPGDTPTTVIFRGTFNIILPSTLRAVTWNVYVRCLVSNCICYIFLVCPLLVRQHTKSIYCFCIFCSPCYVSSVSDTKYHPYFIKRGKLTIRFTGEVRGGCVVRKKKCFERLDIPRLSWVFLKMGLPCHQS